MRLMVPATTTSVMIIEGPSLAELFEASLEKFAHDKGGFTIETRANPRLRYVIADPINMEPMEISLEMIGNWTKVDGHYELLASIDYPFMPSLDGQNVKVTDWLVTEDETDYRGSIADA